MSTSPATADTSRPAMEPVPARAPSRPGGLVRRAWQAYWDWRGRRVTAMLLGSLDDRTLRDIGVSAGEIESLVRSNDDRRRCDVSWLWRCEGGL